jgi:PHD/YefM family antitoxin component YafN of YafNO toxin-antitoxin module
MNQTNPKKLRAELKDYLDQAEKEPIRIQRRAGQTFILMNETLYGEMQSEIISLQQRLLGTLDALAGRTTEYQPGGKARLARFSSRRKTSSR